MNQYYLVPPVAGPMANSLAKVEYLMQSLLDSNSWTSTRVVSAFRGGGR